MKQIICVIGTDGSGKTTLIGKTVEKLRETGVQATGIWFGSKGYLLTPIRMALKPIWRPRKRPNATGKPQQESMRYSTEIKSKNRVVQKYSWAIPIYVSIVWFDYKIQVAFKFLSARNSAVIIADRYIFDVAINIGLTLGWTPEDVVQFVRKRIKSFPIPQALFFLRVEPEVSLSRKNDIPDADYLILRLSYYEALAEAFNFTLLDGTLPINQNRDTLVECVHSTFLLDTKS
ncbi:MAG: hypothetical protein ABJZ69_03045 [Hyphomicrobiales bacterium]